MDEQYFIENVTKCEECGSIPTLVKEIHPILTRKMKSGEFTSLSHNKIKYRVICYNCESKWGRDACRTGACITPDNALKAWNKKMLKGD